MRSRRRLPLEELAPYLLPPAPADQPPLLLDWPTVFGNDHPVEIEVGSGKGHFLLTSATVRPDVNFLGIEIDRKYALYAATRFALRKLSNVRMAAMDAKPLLHQCVRPNSTAAVHIFFPDPWWKQRHRKRRVFTADFVADVARILRPDGLFNIVTDVAEYFEVMLALMRAAPAFTPTAVPEPTAPQHDLDYLTNFERKFRKEGRPIHRAAFVKISA